MNVLQHNKTAVRVIALLCCLLVCIAWAGRLAAMAVAPLVIGGVAVASAALLAAVLLVAYGNSEYADAIKSAAAAAGQPVKTWLQGRAEAFIATQSSLPGALSSTPAGFIYALLSSLRYNADGTLWYGKDLAEFIYNFGNWLTDNGDITISADSGSVINGTLSGMSFNFGDLSAQEIASLSWNEYGMNYISYIGGNTGVKAVAFSGSSAILIASSSAFSYSNGVTTSNPSPVYNHSSATYTYDNKSVYYAYTNVSSSNVTFSSNLVVNAVTGSLDYPKIAWDMIYNASSTGSSNGLDVWNDDTATDGLVLDPTALLGDLWDTLAGSVANVGDYIKALADVIAGIANPAIAIPGLGDIAIPVPIDIPITKDPAIPQERAEDTGVIEEEGTPPYVGTGDYTLSLADFFPFCIPFDIYNMFKMFTGNPVAPRFELPVQYPGVIDEKMVIDLSQFNDAMEIFRNIETVAFVIGLAAATKKLLMGG